MPTAINNPALSTLQNILVYNIQVDGIALNLSPSELKKVEVENKENQHEAALITTQLTKAQISKFAGKRIQFTYGKKTSPATFYGYILTVTPSSEYQQDTVVDLLCIGPTWPLQGGSPKFETNLTAQDMFVKIIKGVKGSNASNSYYEGYSLGVQVDRNASDFVWPALAQTNESDWEFLICLAERVGYCIYVYNGVIRLVKPIRVLTRTRPVTSSFIKGDDVLDPTRALLEWNATTQSLEIRDNIQPSFGFFDEDNKGAFSKLPTPNSPFRFVADTPSKSRAMAEQYENASWINRIDYWNNQATARVNGNAALVPGTTVPIQVSGVAGTASKNDSDGIWLVRGVHHILTHNSFQTELDLARDTNTLPTNLIARNFWEPKVNSGSPKMSWDYEHERWVSSWSQVEYVSETLITDTYVNGNITATTAPDMVPVR
jgi:hypothetical protein